MEFPCPVLRRLQYLAVGSIPLLSCSIFYYVGLSTCGDGYVRSYRHHLPIDSVDFIQVVGCVAVYLWCTYRYSTTVLNWYEGLVYGNLAGNPKWDIHAYASHRTIVIYAWIRRLMGAVLSVEKILEMLTKTLQPGEIPSKLPSSFFTAIACFGYETNLYWFARHCSWHPGPRDKAWILAAHWNRGMGAWEQIQLVAPFSCAVPWTRLVQNTEFT